ncbi:hypothetical protein B9Q11_01065 [Candidatus Marsarchaeota G2 archaeon ECH_B_SAG-F08]|uniref:Uncharacterized protein n=1 Tax=Candidatus Marsarchaeota G2 archaeon ECH_B_SAG-F08 TaxID=1978165 RepID=A0A2R6BKX8_9ARCH|nr:MAG: hypothetical protein B9Q11_01065 [Candidatus Marsarchaeota G2 archaeon ECH_B_SAG-F08]
MFFRKKAQPAGQKSQIITCRSSPPLFICELSHKFRVFYPLFTERTLFIGHSKSFTCFATTKYSKDSSLVFHKRIVRTLFNPRWFKFPKHLQKFSNVSVLNQGYALAPLSEVVCDYNNTRHVDTHLCISAMMNAPTHKRPIYKSFTLLKAHQQRFN